jgi:hypothetical protein
MTRGISHNLRSPKRLTVDIPAATYHLLKQQAAHQHCSIQDLILDGIERVLQPQAHGRRVKFPLIRSSGPKVEMANERLFEVVELP